MVITIFTNIIILENLMAFLSFKSKYSFLVDFYYDLEKLDWLDPQKEHTKTKKMNVYDATSELYNELLKIYLDKYYDFSDARRSKMDPKYDPINLMLDTYDYTEWFKSED